jgi:GT2 family glycosyltransferase
LKDCFTSLLALEYPQDKLELVLVDNASADGSVEFVREHFPRVNIVQNEENLGFCKGNNRGARQASGEYVAFLNNDTRVDPSWLTELVKPCLAEPDVACTASKILDWEGTAVDFVGAVMNFHGFAFQRDFGRRSPSHYDRSGPLLFACGGSMLIRRQLFLDIGGFDEDYFIYFEDVDLGWRLWLLGYRVLFVPSAITYHRLHATMDWFYDFRKTVLYERNALSTLIKNYDEENLARVLPAALLLTTKRAIRYLKMGGWNSQSYDIRGPATDGPFERVHRSAISTLVAVDEVIDNLPKLMAKRAAIQANRKRTDDEVFAQFAQPLKPHVMFHPCDGPYARAHHTVSDQFRVTDLFTSVPKRVLVVASDLLPLPGLPTTGAGLRAWAIGQGLKGRGHRVIFSMPRAALANCQDPVPREIAEFAWEHGNLERVVDAVSPDIVVACGWSVLSNLNRHSVPVVLDQHGPHLLERTLQGHLDASTNEAEKLAGLAKADFFTCAGSRQLDYFLPWLRRAGWQDGKAQSAVLPVSLDPDLPEPHPQPSEEITFVYGGVFLPWQDPSLALNTLVESLEEHGRGLLRFFGGEHPFIPIDTGIFPELKARLEKSTRVEFQPMIPREELLREYTRAHVAIDLMKRNRERELAFTTRTVEYLWCGLPVIYNNFAELADYIQEYDAGWCLDPADAGGLRHVLETILADPSILGVKSANAQRLVRERLTWDKTIDPLEAFVRHPTMRPQPYAQQQPTASPPARPSRKSLRMLLSEAAFHYRRGGLRTLAVETAGFVRRRLQR